MNWINANIRWTMRVSGLLTCTMLLSALAPNAGLQSTFGTTLELTPLSELVVRNWGALIAMVGALLLYGADRPPVRKLVLLLAVASKLVFMGLVLTLGRAYLGTAGLAVAVDSVMVVLFVLYLLRADASSSSAPVASGQSPVAMVAAQAALRARPSNYPTLLATRLQGREKRALGDPFGLQNFGVNLTRLEPGAMSAFRHAHAKQDEFVYILEGQPTLITDQGAKQLEPGMCAGFRSGTGDAHHLVNRTSAPVVFLEVGDRTRADQVSYPDDDLQANFGADGKWTFAHKDGRPLATG